MKDIAPVANDLSTFVFGFAEAMFIKYFGELTASLAADIKDAENIDDLHLPWFVNTGAFVPTGVCGGKRLGFGKDRSEGFAEQRTGTASMQRR